MPSLETPIFGKLGLRYLWRRGSMVLEIQNHGASALVYVEPALYGSGNLEPWHLEAMVLNFHNLDASAPEFVVSGHHGSGFLEPECPGAIIFGAGPPWLGIFWNHGPPALVLLESGLHGSRNSEPWRPGAVICGAEAHLFWISKIMAPRLH